MAAKLNNSVYILHLQHQAQNFNDLLELTHPMTSRSRKSVNRILRTRKGAVPQKQRRNKRSTCSISHCRTTCRLFLHEGPRFKQQLVMHVHSAVVALSSATRTREQHHISHIEGRRVDKIIRLRLRAAHQVWSLHRSAKGMLSADVYTHSYLTAIYEELTSAMRQGSTKRMAFDLLFVALCGAIEHCSACRRLH